MEQLPYESGQEQQPSTFRPEYVESLRRKKIVDELREIRRSLTFRRGVTFYMQEGELAKRIQEDFPDTFQTYQLYYLLVNDEYAYEKDKGSKPNFDFPDEYSIEKFLRDSYEDLKKTIESSGGSHQQV